MSHLLNHLLIRLVLVHLIRIKIWLNRRFPGTLPTRAVNYAAEHPVMPDLSFSSKQPPAGLVATGVVYFLIGSGFMTIYFAGIWISDSAKMQLDEHPLIIGALIFAAMFGLMGLLGGAGAILFGAILWLFRSGKDRRYDGAALEEYRRLMVEMERGRTHFDQ